MKKIFLFLLIYFDILVFFLLSKLKKLNLIIINRNSINKFDKIYIQINIINIIKTRCINIIILLKYNYNKIT